jgi:nitroreductase
MAALLLLLTAVDEGLGGCFFGIPAGRVQAVRAQLGIPGEWDPVGVVAVGHPAPGERSRPSRDRVPLEEVLHRGGWQGAQGAQVADAGPAGQRSPATTTRLRP